MFWLDGDPGVKAENGLLTGTPHGFEVASNDQFAEEDVEKAAADAAERELETLAAGGQGFKIDADVKNAIDDYAMKQAMKYYKEENWLVEDVHIGNEIDLICRRGGEVRHVEVKGTTSPARDIIITRNERLHAEKCERPEVCDVVELYVHRRIKIEIKGGLPVPTGGDAIVCSPWILNIENLRPISYMYRLLTDISL
jgi:Domain of unknown function (DUF3883)